MRKCWQLTLIVFIVSSCYQNDAINFSCEIDTEKQDVSNYCQNIKEKLISRFAKSDIDIEKINYFFDQFEICKDIHYYNSQFSDYYSELAVDNVSINFESLDYASCKWYEKSEGLEEQIENGFEALYYDIATSTQLESLAKLEKILLEEDFDVTDPSNLDKYKEVSRNLNEFSKSDSYLYADFNGLEDIEIANINEQIEQIFEDVNDLYRGDDIQNGGRFNPSVNAYKVLSPEQMEKIDTDYYSRAYELALEKSRIQTKKFRNYLNDGFSKKLSIKSLLEEEFSMRETGEKISVVFIDENTNVDFENIPGVKKIKDLKSFKFWGKAVVTPSGERFVYVYVNSRIRDIWRVLPFLIHHELIHHYRNAIPKANNREERIADCEASVNLVYHKKYPRLGAIYYRDAFWLLKKLRMASNGNHPSSIDRSVLIDTCIQAIIY